MIAFADVHKSKPVKEKYFVPKPLEDILRTPSKDWTEEDWITVDKYFRPMAIAVLVKRGVPPEQAEEIYQDAMLSIKHSKTGYDPKRGDFRSYFLKILLNAWRNWYRKSKAAENQGLEIKSLDDDNLHATPSDWRPSPEDSAELHIMLRGCLRQLSQMERNVWVLRAIHEFSYKEIGAALHITEVRARVIYNRDANPKIRSCMSGKTGR